MLGTARIRDHVAQDGSASALVTVAPRERGPGHRVGAARAGGRALHGAWGHPADRGGGGRGRCVRSAAPPGLRESLGGESRLSWVDPRGVPGPDELGDRDGLGGLRVVSGDQVDSGLGLGVPRLAAPTTPPASADRCRWRPTWSLEWADPLLRPDSPMSSSTATTASPSPLRVAGRRGWFLDDRSGPPTGPGLEPHGEGGHPACRCLRRGPSQRDGGNAATNAPVLALNAHLGYRLCTVRSSSVRWDAGARSREPGPCRDPRAARAAPRHPAGPGDPRAHLRAWECRGPAPTTCCARWPTRASWPTCRRAPLRPRGGGVRGGQRVRPPGAAAADRPSAAGRAGRPRRPLRTPRRAARPRRPLRAGGAGTRPAPAGHRRRGPAAGAPHRQRPGGPGRSAGSPGARALPRHGGVRRPARHGPTSPSALRSLLAETRQRGYAVEEGEVTPGFASVAAPVLDHNGHPVAGVAVTYPPSRTHPIRPGSLRHAAYRAKPPVGSAGGRALTGSTPSGLFPGRRPVPSLVTRGNHAPDAQ